MMGHLSGARKKAYTKHKKDWVWRPKLAWRPQEKGRRLSPKEIAEVAASMGLPVATTAAEATTRPSTARSEATPPSAA